jgi:hypothetical protein
MLGGMRGRAWLAVSVGAAAVLVAGCGGRAAEGFRRTSSGPAARRLIAVMEKYAEGRQGVADAARAAGGNPVATAVVSGFAAGVLDFDKQADTDTDAWRKTIG